MYMPQQMNPQVMPDPHTSVLVQGDVRNAIVPWTEELTLARAIVAADYIGKWSPHSIAVIRNGRSQRISTTRLLHGDDMYLEPGDIVEIRR